MPYPKIGIVTACYNHEEYIEETVKSVLSQNYPNLKYIVLDDGSTDNSWKKIKKYKDKLFHCERLEGYRKTVVPALNIGIKKLNTEIMGWLNSDDILLPKSLFTIADVFSELKEVDWFTGIACTINEKSEIVNLSPRRKNKHDYLSGNWQVIQQESTFWRKNLWEKTGAHLNENFIQGFDSELWTRFFEKADHYFLTAPIGAYRKIGQSRSIRAKEEFTRYTEKALEKMKRKTKNSEILASKIYAFIKKYLRFGILENIPDNIFSKIPYLNKFVYKYISYNLNTESWQIGEQNPFKKVYGL